MDKLYTDLKYEILKFVSYFDLDSILPLFNFTPDETVLIKQKIYNQRLTVTKCSNRTEYTIEGNRHREGDFPAIEYFDGDKEWRVNENLHRLDGPAVEYVNGDKSWWFNGKRHRLDGPAVECTNGVKVWWVNGKRHNINGPAMVSATGRKLWYINGEPVPEF